MDKQPGIRHGPSMIRILIVDDHAIVRQGLKQILAEERDMEVTETASANEAIKLVRERPVHLAVVDLDLPGKNGLELLKEIKHIKPELPVLILSIHSEEQFAVRTLKAGASGFLSKDAAPEELQKAIRKILQGGRYISNEVAEQLLFDLGKSSAKPPHESLSDREFQVLMMLGAGKTVKEIAAELNLSIPTISTYRARLLDKMNMKTTAELVRYAIENRLAR
jgi:two-component system, NarL family, invasion response regulator UvrY